MDTGRKTGIRQDMDTAQRHGQSKSTDKTKDYSIDKRRYESAAKSREGKTHRLDKRPADKTQARGDTNLLTSGEDGCFTSRLNKTRQGTTSQDMTRDVTKCKTKNQTRREKTQNKTKIRQTTPKP
jgi:hypothetical protein